MTPELCLRLHSIRHAVLGARDRGRVVIEFSAGPQVPVDFPTAQRLADGMLALVNLPLLGLHWRESSRDHATDIITTVLHEDLETERSSVPRNVAAALTDRVLSLFNDAIFLTNVKPTADLTQSPHKWASGRIDAELDAGVAIVSSELVGIVWVEDRP
ncbi:MAG TPA: hypothetical protein VGN72_20485 [Tepidisphaeraceae bacterium]|jgi:hypothetical protein|nr:hypothetical protein [Tepidisphaeraceae bacterium]